MCECDVHRDPRRVLRTLRGAQGGCEAHTPPMVRTSVPGHRIHGKRAHRACRYCGPVRDHLGCVKYSTAQRFTSTRCEAESPTHFVSRHTTGSTRTLYCSTSLPLLFALAGLADQPRHQLDLGASCLVHLLHLVGGRVALAPSSRRTTGARVHKAFPRVSWVCKARGSSAGGVVRVIRSVCFHHLHQRPRCRPCHLRRVSTPHPRRTTRTYSQVAALSGELVAAALFSSYHCYYYEQSDCCK